MAKTIALWLFLPYGKGNAYYNRVQRIAIPLLVIGIAIGLILQLSEENSSDTLGLIGIIAVGVGIGLTLIGTIIGLPLARRSGERIERVANVAMNLYLADYLNSFDPLSPYFIHIEGVERLHRLGDNIPDAAFMVRYFATDYPVSRLLIINIHNWGLAMVPYNWGWDYRVSEHFTLENGETS